MRYTDFSIKIEPPRDGVFPVNVIRSPAGEDRGTMYPPFEVDALNEFLEGFAERVRATGTGGSRAESSTKSPSGPEAENLGDELFRALFGKELLSLLDESLGGVRRERHRGLRIKLHFDLKEPALAQLASLPWEFLYRHERRLFLGLSRKTPIVRYLDLPKAAEPPHLESPLRILVVASNPAGFAPLRLEEECRNLERALAGRPEIEVTFLKAITAGGLRQVLLERRAHVLHFMGHGTFSEETGEGGLLLADDRGRAAAVAGSVLGNILRDIDSLRLVVLNSCDGARVARRQGLDPFAGVAHALLLAGCPSVVAMQFPISDRAAILFSEALYQRVAAGDPIDSATVEGRLAIHFDDENSQEWGTPVLFLRVPDGRLFTSPPATKGAVRTSGTDVPEAIRREIIDCRDFIAEKIVSFIGREWLVDAIHRFTVENPCGYLLVRGDPGIGKSALIAHMVHASGHIHHFNIRAEGVRRPENFLANVCAQLIARYDLDVPSLPSEATRNGRFLRQILEDVSSRLRDSGGKALLLVDALDEADTSVTEDANVLFLPPTLPPGVYVIATTRRGGPSLRIDCEQRILDIEQDSVGNLTDVRVFLESRLNSPGIRAYLRDHDLTEDIFVAEMLEKSQGNFMYLRYVLPEIERGVYRDRVLTALPRGLGSYYEDHWRRMRSRDERTWFDYNLPVLTALTVVREPVSLELISDFSGIESRQRIRAVLAEWDAFLYSMEAEGEDGQVRRLYRLYHVTFQDFIAAKEEVREERIDLEGMHGRIADRLWQRLSGLK